MTCGWAYDAPRAGGPGTRCGALATAFVRYRVDGRVVGYCLNHGQREVLGGQAAWSEPEDPRQACDCERCDCWLREA